MPRNVLFLCTANSARSILAEAILAARGGTRFVAYSAGSQPRGLPNPCALELLAAKGHDVGGLASKSWDVFAGPGAPVMDLVITVCDNAKGEMCPIWPGHPAQAHWGIPDPAGHGTDGALDDFETAYQRLATRIDALLALDEEAMKPRAWRDAVTRIGREMEGATHG
ncbi:arsenate reductase ArsC [Erythrobacter sp. SDW2]|uniref:arsenate reductase ArsC n=1 Tax=Erythrobacter sp. SDW2 TaxID=2907154 RepID=UPI001F3F3F4B|nr:arsenate reductase ArsC [Erythrobacter sp. SDW2]UIP07124.1 arsenate reductase ArsC [Erythrobacter sp. SDW2]